MSNRSSTDSVPVSSVYRRLLLPIYIPSLLGSISMQALLVLLALSVLEAGAGAPFAAFLVRLLVQGRNSDELQGIFRVSYDLLQETDKEAEWKTYEHDVHGFVYVQRNDAGVYDPDAVQLEGVKDSIAFFDKYMKP